jgi:PHD/YefM family antitoxin component YafN of YafNO toxin-antitoxin module
MTLNPQFLTDKKGKKTAVQLSLKEYEYLIEELELKEDIAVYEKIKADKQNNTEADWEVVKKRLDKKHRIKS